VLSLSFLHIGKIEPLRNFHYTVFAVILAFIIVLPSYTAENDNDTRAVTKPELRLGSTEVFRGNSTLISLHSGLNDTEKYSCTIQYSRDGKDWYELPAILEEEHFTADFITSHATPAGDAFFRGMVTNRSTSEASEWSDTATLTIKNNPPVAFFTIPDARGVMGGELLLSGAGCYDKDGTILSYTWFMDGVELGTSTSKNEMRYKVGEAKTGWVNFTLEVTDNEGGVALSAPVPLEIVKNTVRTGNVTFHSYDSGRSIKDNEKWEGTVRLEGNFTDLLGFDNIEINISDNSGKLLVNKRLTYKENTSGDAGISRVTSMDGILTSWFFYLDTTLLKDGKYVVEIKAENGANTGKSTEKFEVMNGPPPRETHFLIFLLMGSGIFIIFAVIGFVIAWYDKKILGGKLGNIGYRPKDVSRHLPLVSRISLAASFLVLVLLLLIAAWFMESFLLFVILCIAMGITGVCAYRVFSERSTIMAIAGGIFTALAGILFLLIMNRDYPDQGQIWGLASLSLLILIMCGELVCSFLYNRNYLILLQNRLENETSVARNMSLNAFSIGAGDEKKTEIIKNEYRANVFAKISYTHFNNGEIKIGIFDVNDWKRETKLAKIMLSEFIGLMKKKTPGEKGSRSVEIKVLTSDTNRKEKKEALLLIGFLQAEGKGDSREMVFRYEPV